MMGCACMLTVRLPVFNLLVGRASTRIADSEGSASARSRTQGRRAGDPRAPRQLAARLGAGSEPWLSAWSAEDAEGLQMHRV